MTEIMAVSAIAASPFENAASVAVRPDIASASMGPVNFSNLLTQGIASMDAKVAHADHMVSRFALDDSVPLHQVTIALEEARLSVEFAMQVRQRFVEGYREFMTMQL